MRVAVSPEGIAAASARHPGRVLALWGVAIVVSIGVIAMLLGDSLTTEGRVTNNPESEQAYALEARVPPTGDYVSDVVVVRSASSTVSDPSFRATVTQLAAQLGGTAGVERAATFYETGNRELVSPDRHATLIALTPGFDTEDRIPELYAVVDRFDGRNGVQVAITGEQTTDEDYTKLSEDDLRKGELFFGLPAALVILLLVFGAVVTAFVPILMAIVSIIVALALTAIVGQQFELSFYVVNMLTGMGLALGIDYSLFVVSRYREQRRLGDERRAAIDVAGQTACRAVAFSGSAFVLAMLGMVLVPDTILRSLAVGAILVGIVSVAAALTLLPALLALAGDRINALRLPFLGRSAGAEGRFWSAIVHRVMRRPGISLAAGVAVLLLLAAPVLDLGIGQAGIQTLPERFHSRQGFEALDQAFGVGTLDDVDVVVEGDVASAQITRAIGTLRKEMREARAFGPSSVEPHEAQGIAIVSAPVLGDSRDTQAIAAVRHLRNDLVPAAFGTTDARALVTGETAEAIDYFALIDRWLPIVFTFVLGLSFVLLTLAFRSVVVAAKAIVLNLLSVGAAYGLLVLVFQKGVGNELFGFEQVQKIEAWVPLFLFSVLFGLSMDYHVFLLSRIRERYTETGDNAAAVAFAIGSTARLITGAALIIVAVFAGFAAGDLVMFQQMGFGVAVSLLLDATLIRSVLVPAAMTLLGPWNWYLPSWLEWLPRISVEGAGIGRRAPEAVAPTPSA
jgi:RND superfamily putative drug exporter